MSYSSRSTLRLWGVCGIVLSVLFAKDADAASAVNTVDLLTRLTYESDCASDVQDATPVGTGICVFFKPDESYQADCENSEILKYDSPDCSGSATTMAFPPCTDNPPTQSFSLECVTTDADKLITAIVTPANCTSENVVDTSYEPIHSLVAIEGACNRDIQSANPQKFYKVELQYDNMTVLTHYDNDNCTGTPLSRYSAPLDGGCLTLPEDKSVQFSTTIPGAVITRPPPPATFSPTSLSTTASPTSAGSVSSASAIMMFMAGLLPMLLTLV